MTHLEFAGIRSRLKRTQREMAELLGVSLKAVESYEQGWRRIPANIERILYFLLFRINQKVFSRNDRCWIDKKCSADLRANCPAWIVREGRYCWFLTGKMCRAGKGARPAGNAGCSHCAFFRKLLKKITD